MALRVTDAEVKELIPTTKDTVPFIETANLLVTELLASAGLTAERLTAIELYLSAHFVALSDEKGGLIETRLGDGIDTFADHYDEGLKLTRFGQQALSLDSTGTLVSMASASKRAEIKLI